MRVAVFGLGYVGCVTAACLARRGHDVVGVDISDLKVEMIQAGSSPVLERGLNELVAEVVAEGRLRATKDAREAVLGTDVSLICVGTPSAPNGSLDTGALERVLDKIGEALPDVEGRHTVVVRSTTLPGTAEGLVRPRLEQASGRRAGADFGLATNPEFLREGSSLVDFENPPKTVIGQFDEASGEVVAALYEGISAPLFRVRPGVAELVKYVDNAFHALKITFANEIGTVARAFGLDSHEVMEIFCSDTKLNISPAYLKPGFSFGGSCLPKDLRALLYSAKRADADLPLLASILPSNELHLRRVADAILATGRRRVGFFGLSFKPGTDDLRESPLVELAERLLGKGLDLRIYDAAVSMSKLVGANKEYIEERIPHLSSLLAESPAEVIDHAEVLVVGAAAPETVTELQGAELNGRVLVDLARLPDAAERRDSDAYLGVGW